MDMEYDSDYEYDYGDLDSDEDFDYEAEQKKHGMMFGSGHIMDFLMKYRYEETFSEDTRRFLKQVRETSGYEVDCMPDDLHSPFIPYEPGWHPFVAEMLAGEAMRSINKQVEKEGECYDLVRIERYVETHEGPKLLTLLVKDGGGTEKRLRACVGQCRERRFRCYLIEWKLVEWGEDEGWRFVADEVEEGQGYSSLTEEEEKEKKESVFVLLKVLLGGGDGGKDLGMVVVAKIKSWVFREQLNENVYNVLKKDGLVGEKGSILKMELLQSSRSSINFFGEVKRVGMLNAEEGKDSSTSTSVSCVIRRLEKFKKELEGMRNDTTKVGILLAEKGTISGHDIYDMMRCDSVVLFFERRVSQGSREGEVEMKYRLRMCEEIEGGKGKEVKAVTGWETMEEIEGGKGKEVKAGTEWETVEEIEGGKGKEVKAGKGKEVKAGTGWETVEEIEGGKGKEVKAGTGLETMGWLDREVDMKAMGCS